MSFTFTDALCCLQYPCCCETQIDQVSFFLWIKSSTNLIYIFKQRPRLIFSVILFFPPPPRKFCHKLQASTCKDRIINSLISEGWLPPIVTQSCCYTLLSSYQSAIQRAYKRDVAVFVKMIICMFAMKHMEDFYKYFYMCLFIPKG